MSAVRWSLQSCSGTWKWGADRHLHAVRKEIQEKLMLDKSGVPLRSESGDLLYHTEEMFGYGVVGIGHISGIVHIYQLDEPYNRTLESIFQKILRQDSVDQNLSYLTRWDVIQNDVVAVYGNLPEIFEDFIKSN